MASSLPAPLDAANVTYLWARLLVEELVRLGVTRFYVAPGSRSTPLTVAVAQHPETQVVLHVDERGNAFAALGWGRASQRPAGWITTSGTAVANGHPAVVEASVDGVPMVLLTADRPPELRDTGANQTIDQVKFFGDYVRWEADVPPPSETVDPAYVLTTVDKAVHHAVRVPPGPVHLNCGFRKPLEPTEDGSLRSIPTAVEDWARSTGPYTRYPTPTPRASTPDVEALVDAFRGAERGLIVAGRLDGADEAEAARRLAEHTGWPLVPDVTSRLRLGGEARPWSIDYADLVLVSAAFRQHRRPEVVVQLGGRFVSKRLRQFLAASRPAVRALVRPSPARVDPDHRVTHHVETEVGAFVETVVQRLEGPAAPGDWRDRWTAANRAASTEVEQHAAQEGLTEPALAAVLTRHLPPDHALVAANSMPVRDLNRHAAVDGERRPVFANRGASGIDGTVATTAGIAHGHGGAATLLIGDLALWHDLNSLALLGDLPVVVVVVNNDGGGIFHFLPIREHAPVFDPYFTTPQDRRFEAAADTFGLGYHQPDTVDAFRAVYRQACDTSGPVLIEVQTDREENRRQHERLEQRVARAVDKTVEAAEE